MGMIRDAIERKGLAINAVSRICEVSELLIRMLDAGHVTHPHPRIAHRVAKLLELTPEQEETLKPEEHRGKPVPEKASAMNRADRRAAAKLTHNIAYQRNIADVKRKEARKAISFKNKFFIAATVLVLHDELGLDTERVSDVLAMIADVQFNALSAEELWQRVEEELGITIPDMESGLYE